jgi:hypothetical protein
MRTTNSRKQPEHHHYCGNRRHRGRVTSARRRARMAGAEDAQASAPQQSPQHPRRGRRGNTEDQAARRTRRRDRPKAGAAQAEADVKTAQATGLQQQAAARRSEAATSRDHLNERWDRAENWIRPPRQMKHRAPPTKHRRTVNSLRLKPAAGFHRNTPSTSRPALSMTRLRVTRRAGAVDRRKARRRWQSQTSRRSRT